MNVPSNPRKSTPAWAEALCGNQRKKRAIWYEKFPSRRPVDGPFPERDGGDVPPAGRSGGDRCAAIGRYGRRRRGRGGRVVGRIRAAVDRDRGRLLRADPAERRRQDRGL